MATVLEKANYIAKLNDTAIKFETDLERKDARAKALDEVVGKGFPPEDRDALRELLDFSIKTKGKFGQDKILKSHAQNQRKGIETEDSKHYQSIEKGDLQFAGTAMKKILELRDTLLKKLGPDGKPLFTKEEIADELFTPLVREGILPETLVPDEYSETAKMLNEVFKDYRKFVETKKEDRDEKEVKTDFEASGGSGTKKMVAAKGKNAAAYFKRQIDNKIENKLGSYGITATRQERQRGFKMGITGLKAVMKGKKAISSIQGLPLEITQILDSKATLPPGYAFNQGDPSGLVDLVAADKLAEEQAANPEDILLMGNLLNSIEGVLGEDATPEVMDEFADLFDQALNDVAGPIRKALATDTGTFVITMLTTVKKFLSKTATGGNKIRSLVDKLNKADEAMKNALEVGAKRTLFNVAAVKVSSELDSVIESALMKSSPSAAIYFDGAFSEYVDTDKWVDQAMAVDDEKDPFKVVESIGDGFEKAVEKKMKDPLLASVFNKAAERFKKTFESSASLPTGMQALKDTPDKAFGWLVEPCKKAAIDAFGDKEFNEQLQLESLKNSLSELAKGDNAVLEDQLLDSAKEVEDFERQLVLVDEGGMEMAKQQSMVKLTEQLRKDRLVLEIVESAGKLLRGFGRGGTSIGVESFNYHVETHVKETVEQVGKQTFASEVGGQVTAALNAARLIIQLTVNAIRAAERWTIWAKFSKDIEMALKARSVVLPAIENFYKNKKEQIAFHTIEDAMLAIQLAGSIASTVPEPISMAVGKTLTSVGKAGELANKFGKQVYDEVTVRNAWKKTLEAIDNPKNRKAGLQAIHDNILLAAHSVAWAAMNHEPIAEQIMRSCGVNAQTLADNDTDAKKIVKYLMLFLSDTGKGEVKFEEALSDHQKMNIQWKPPKVELTVTSWFMAKNRGETLANPKLRPDPTKDIDNALRALPQLPTTDKLKTLLANPLSMVTLTELESYEKTAQTLLDAFQAYAPRTPDNSKHTEMAQLTGEYSALAADLVLSYKSIVEDFKSKSKTTTKKN